MIHGGDRGPLTSFVVVIDDDPTGCQTVSEVPVITCWEDDDLRWLLSRDRSMGFVLTNSRAMQAEQAAAVNRDIVDRATALGAERGVAVSVLSRSDSTLRGHFAVEVGAICRALEESGHPVDLILLAPAFFEAGRITHDDIHYVSDSGLEQPVADTAYANDPAFAFAESDLTDWVRARLGDPEASVTTLPLPLLREDDTEAVARRMLGMVGKATPGRMPPVVIANGTCQLDYDVVARAVRRLEANGVSVVSRCGPSYVASRLGEPVPLPLHGLSAAGSVAGPGLVVVGSHVPLSTAQLAVLVDELGPSVVELDPVEVTGPDRQQHTGQLVDAVCAALATGDDVVLATSRSLLSGPDVRGSLDIAGAVSSAINEVVEAVLDRTPPSWIVAKGGITSARMISDVLRLRRGWIVGQMQKGLVPMWRDDDTSSRKPPCVIFPGNVGTPQTLLEVVRSLTEDRDARLRH